MHEKAGHLQRLIECGVIAIIRTHSADTARQIARAAIAGGAAGVEVTLTTPDGLSIISELSKEYGERAIIGAGTVLNATVCAEAIHAGAKFIVSPAFDAQTVQVALKSGVISIPGAFTPAEILAVARAGADLIKVFPSTSVGPTYFRDLLRPLPHLKLIATGGVTLNDVEDWIKAGSVLVGVGGDLIPGDAAERGNWAAISARTTAFIDKVRQARVR